MPRTARMVIPNEQAVYHVISRTALDKFPMGAVENDFLLKLIKRFSRLYFTEIMGFCLMGNHFHLLVKMLPESDFSDDDIEISGTGTLFINQDKQYKRKECLKTNQNSYKLEIPCQEQHE